MKRSIEVLLIVAALGLTTTVGILTASEDKKPAAAPKVSDREKYDANHDGTLSDSEKATMKSEKDAAKAEREAGRRTKALAKYDANKNGAFDPEEEAKWKADLEEAKDKRREKAAEKKAKSESESVVRN